MLKLYSYWRSSSAYRVRIALALKGIEYEYLPVHLVKDGGEQNQPAYRALNPEGRVPLLVDGDFRLTQSLAILEYLESRSPQPALIPADAKRRVHMWAFCHAIAGDIQPMQNTGVLNYLSSELGVDNEQKKMWLRFWIERGLGALEQEMRDADLSAYAFGASVTLADCVLVPQMYAAERFGCDLGKFTRLHAVAERCRKLDAFVRAHPDRQPDANR
jgi:maleylacetoacetate isomerase